MKYSLNWIKNYTNLPTQNLNELDEVISRIATQIVDVDERWLSEKDTIIDVDNKIITNRPYCFGHRGLAREIAVMLNQPYSGNNYPLISNYSMALATSVKIEAPDLCPRFMAVAIKGIKVAPSPEWLIAYLESIGQRSINNVVDITNFIMLDTAQPVHVYDYHKIVNGEIIVRRAKSGEEIVTLDGIKRKLREDMLLIADAEKAVGIAGVMGAENSEIDNQTTDIILEVASFHPINIRQTAKVLKHRTDAVQRFEKGPDPTNIPNVLALLANLIIEVAGGEIASPVLDINNLDQSTLRVKPFEMNFKPNRVDKLLGFGISESFIKQVFDGFGVKILKDEFSVEGEKIWQLEIPAYRSDLKEPADLIEDIGRMFGYQNIPSTIPVNQLIPPPVNKKLIALDKARTALTASGLDEVITYPFISQKDAVTFDLKNLISIVNPLSEEYVYLRNSLLPSHAKVTSHNAKYLDSFGIFEISRKFIQKTEEAKPYSEDKGISQQPDEIEVISMMYYDKAKKEHSIFELKGAIEHIFKNLSISNYAINSDGNIFLNGQQIGLFGLLGKKALDIYNLDYPVSYATIELEPLVRNMVEIVKFKDFSRYQGSRLDYSVIVPMSLPIDEVTARIPDYPLIVDREVFDVYKELPQMPGKKSVSFSLYIQKMDGTVTDEDIFGVGSAVEASLKQIPGLEIRGGGLKARESKGAKNVVVPVKLPTEEIIAMPRPEGLTVVPSKEEVAIIQDSQLTVEVQNREENRIVIGQVVDLSKHPNADRLQVCKIDVGSAKPENTLYSDYLQIVCGATNISTGDIVPVALPGAIVPGLKDDLGNPIIIAKREMRGILSEGMLCSKRELGLGNDHSGIWLLDKGLYGNKVGERFAIPALEQNKEDLNSQSLSVPSNKYETQLIYLVDSYRKEMDATVLEVENEGKGQYCLILDKTVFYPMGGGQATDQGELKSKNWEGKVYQVLLKNGNVVHYVKSNIKPEVGDSVHGEINWDRRYKNMRLHSAGHVVDFAMYGLGYSPKILVPYKGDHNKNPHIVYKGKIDKDIKQELEDKSNEIVSKGLNFSWYFQSLHELEKEAIYLQPGLPSNKPLRALSLEGFGCVADGGTQVKNTLEIKKIRLEVKTEGDETIVYYSIE